MTDLEAFHWLKKMRATVLLDDGWVMVVVSSNRNVVSGDRAGATLDVAHRDEIIEVRSDNLARATEEALQAWRQQRSAVDGLADLTGAPESITSGVCSHCSGTTVERAEIGESFELVRVILCTACGAKTFISPESSDDAKARGARGARGPNG